MTHDSDHAGSHLTRKKPAWTYGEKMEGEVSVVGPAGSMAVWLSSTWHKPGRNDTDTARRGASATSAGAG